MSYSRLALVAYLTLALLAACAGLDEPDIGPVGFAGRLGSYRAHASGSVLFGFADQDTGFEILEEGGCNDGTWFRTQPSFNDPIGPSGARVIAGGVPVAIEFVMGEDSGGAFGIDSCGGRASPTPDSRLISFPIYEP